MRTRKVVPVVLWLAAAGASAVAASEPPREAWPDDRPARRSASTSAAAPAATRVSPTSHGTATPAAKLPKPPTLEEAAAIVGVPAPELKRLRQLGFGDAELSVLLKKSGRTAQELIAEREIVNEVGKAIEDTNARVYQMTPVQASAERERSMKAALAKVRRDRRMAREDLRKVLAGTSFFNADELKRYLGSGGLFGVDDLTLRRTGWPAK